MSPPSAPHRHLIDALTGPGGSVLRTGAEQRQGCGPFRHPAEVDGRERRRQGTPTIGQTCSRRRRALIQHSKYATDIITA